MRRISFHPPSIHPSYAVQGSLRGALGWGLRDGSHGETDAGTVARQQVAPVGEEHPGPRGLGRRVPAHASSPPCLRKDGGRFGGHARLGKDGGKAVEGYACLGRDGGEIGWRDGGEIGWRDEGEIGWRDGG